jgi:hypothetical protein
MVDSFTLQYYYEGFSVAYRPTPQGWRFWLWVLRRLARPCARAPSPAPLSASAPRRLTTTPRNDSSKISPR